MFFFKWKPNNFTTNILAGFSCFFTILFIIEAFMKIVALGFYGYWQSKRNRFDLFANLMAFSWMILHIVSLFKTNLVSLSYFTKSLTEIVYPILAIIKPFIWFCSNCS